MKPPHEILDISPASNTTSSSAPGHSGIKTQPGKENTKNTKHESLEEATGQEATVSIQVSQESTMVNTYTLSSNSPLTWTQVPHHRHRLYLINATQPKNKIILSDLPNELLFIIIKKLRLIHSACLGLTAKRFYQINWDARSKLSLISDPEDSKSWNLFQRARLCELINAYVRMTYW